MIERDGMQITRRPGVAAGRAGGAWSGFLVMAFVVLGLCGLFATYAAQLPYRRLEDAETRLDRALAAPDAAHRLAMLRDTLGADGRGVFDGRAPLADQVAGLRAGLRRHFVREAADIALRLRIVLCVFTFAACLFGLMVVSVLRRATG